VPSGFLFYQIGKEASIGYIRVQQHVSTGFESCAGNKVCDFLRSPQVKYQIQANTEKVTKYIEEGAKDFIFSIPKRIIELLIMLLSIFFFLRDGPEILSGLRNIAPLKDHHEEKIASQLKEVTRAIVYGIFVVAVFEAIIAALVFWLAGISSPILWAVVIAILAFIPLIGPAVIWVPAAAISLISHHPASAIILIIGGLVISSIDFFVKPRVIGKRAKVHSLIIFVGLLGGIAFFGISGIVLGPLILALLITFLKIYKEERLA
jgi:predicted PurR-regulated permease PerM